MGEQCMIDNFGRVHRDLRVSLTDRCSLRCNYCMPHDFSNWLPHENQLTTNELIQVIEAAVAQGITEVRLTGGEPLLRPDLVGIVDRIHSIENAPEISMTTNGVGLAKIAQALKDAGLQRLNISLDTLDWERFKRITHRDRFDDVMQGIAAAKAADFSNIKINAVLMRGINDGESVELLKWAMNESLQLRFIEQMPLDAGGIWKRDEMITADEIFAELSKEFVLTPKENRGSSPSEDFLVNGGPYSVGIIGSVTRPFCANCDRIRLTSDGQLRSCLFAMTETDLRSILRDKTIVNKDQRLQELFLTCVKSKLPGHGINDPSFNQPSRPMSAIGG